MCVPVLSQMLGKMWKKDDATAQHYTYMLLKSDVSQSTLQETTEHGHVSSMCTATPARHELMEAVLEFSENSLARY
jgi:hypothetical protein